VQSPELSQSDYPSAIDAKTIYFVRHGQTEWNAAARMQGQQDSDLNDVGRRQAEEHGRLLARLGVDALYVSPLNRARQTLAIVQRFVALDARADDRIKEWNCGLWSGQFRAEVRKRWPHEWAALEADPYHYRGPGCENYPDMIARSRPFVEELLASPERRIAVISHGMIGRVMVGTLMGFDESAMLDFRQPNDVIYRVRLHAEGGSARLDHYNSGIGPIDGLVPR
jgi:broad specificity phosphatase PhoE